MDAIKNDKIRQSVRNIYGEIASNGAAGCGCSCGCDDNTITAEQLSSIIGYSQSEMENAPEGANLGLGCGNPQLIASLKEGETVLDLGSGGGFDAFLAARSVGTKGHVIGVDMTPEMISKARENTIKTDLENVEFRLGEIENLPVADDTVDVIISNCVINLSPDKKQVFSEAFRVLKKGGRLAISDIVTEKPLPEELKENLNLYAACISGAAPIEKIKEDLDNVGFSEIEITQKYTIDGSLIGDSSLQLGDYIKSVSIEAIK